MTIDIVSGASRITIDVTSRAGTRLGSGPLITCAALSYTTRLDGAGDFSVLLPHNDPRVLRWVRVKSCKFEIYIDSKLRLIGIPESLRVTMGPDGKRMIQVSGRDQAAELAEQSVGFLELSDGSDGVDDGPAQIVALASGWSMDTATGFATTLTDVYAKFAGESILSALIKVAEKIGEHFYIHPTLKRVVWLRATTPDSNLRAVPYAGEPSLAALNPRLCFIQQWGEETEGYELATRIYPYGGGSGDTRLTLAAANASVPVGFTLDSDAKGYYIESDAAAEAIGADIDAAREFKDIRPLSNTSADLVTASNMLLKTAVEWLKLRDDSDDVVSYALSVVGLSGDANPGHTIAVEYQDELYTVDDDLVMLEIARTLAPSGTETAKLTVASLARRLRSDAAYIDGQLESGKVYSAYPQINGNSYETAYRIFVGEDQTEAKGEIRFPLRDDVVQVLKVIFGFTLEELVNTTTTVSSASTSSGASSESSTPSGGGSTTESGGGSTSGSGASHSHTVTIGDHSHDIAIYDSSGAGSPSHSDVYFDRSNDLLVVYVSGTDNPDYAATSEDGGSTSPTSSSESTHTHTTPAHTHNTPAHTHNIEHTHEVTPDIDTAVGIYREESANTYGIDDLQYRINGGGWLALSGATLITGSTYELDITDAVSDANFRPILPHNLIEVRHDGSGGAKTVMLDVLLGVRTKIQSINYQ